MNLLWNKKSKRSRNAGFDATNPFCKTTYICSSCGKRTRETGQSESGVGLCAKCYNEAGLENEHSDYGHETYNPDCPTCRYEKEQAKKNSPKKSHKKLPRECVFNENGNCLNMDGKPCDRTKRNERTCVAFCIDKTSFIYTRQFKPVDTEKVSAALETLEQKGKEEPTKLCHHCQQTKPVSEFYKSKVSKDGYAPSCKACQNVTWRDQN